LRFIPTYFGIIIAFSATDAYAGAWTQPEGTALVITGASYYNSTAYRDNQGRKKSQPAYNKFELNPYFEYGLTDGLTLGGSLSLQAAYQNVTAAGLLSHYGIGDSEFFLRTRLWQQDGFALSAEPMVKLPSPSSSHSPRLGGAHPNAGMGLSGGYGWDKHFVGIDTQYRHRFGEPRDQFKLSGTLGISLSDRWTVMPQFFMTWRSSTPPAAAFTQSSGDDYDLARLQFSAMYKLRENLSFQFGAFRDMDGKNTGAGNGVLFSLWQTL